MDCTDKRAFYIRDIRVIRVNKSDEILAVNEARAYYDHLGKAHSDRYEIRMRE